MSTFRLDDLPPRVRENIFPNALTGCWEWARPGDFHPTDSTVAYEHAARIARGV